MLRRAGATTTGRYTLMLREGGNTLGSTIIGNLGLGKGNININQVIKNSIKEGFKENNGNLNNIEKNNGEFRDNIIERKDNE